MPIYHDDIDLARDAGETKLFTCAAGHVFEDYAVADPGWCPYHDSLATKCVPKPHERKTDE